jgi:hypothetical protein
LNPTVARVLKRLRYPLDVILTCFLICYPVVSPLLDNPKKLIDHS